MLFLFSLVLAVIGVGNGALTSACATDKIPATVMVSAAPACAAALSGDALFDPVVDLDDEFPLLNKRAEKLRKEGVLEWLQSGEREFVPREATLHVIENLQTAMSGYSGRLLAEGLLHSSVPAQPEAQKAASLFNELNQVAVRLKNEKVTREEFNSLVVKALGFAWLRNANSITENWLGEMQWREKRGQGASFLQALLLAFTPHPESVLYLLSRGVFVAEVADRAHGFDGVPPASPYVIARHDDTHIEGLQNDLSVTVRTQFYDRLLQFINRPKQTLRQRELAIYILFFSFFERSRPFTHLSIEKTFEPGEISDLVERLNRKNDIGSALIKQRPVTFDEADAVQDQFAIWLRRQRP